MQVSKEIDSLADQIYQDYKQQNNNLALIGIRRGGEILADRLKSILESKYNLKINYGCLDITLYRDDANLNSAHMPVLRASEIDFSLDNLFTVLVDDVLYTGRTVRAALEALNDFGRAAKIKLAVLVERDKDICRELPIAADFIGLKSFEPKAKTIKINFDANQQGDQIVIT